MMFPAEVDPDVFCCELSLELGEPAYGTALNREVWFLLEYDGLWPAKATTDNDLPQSVQDWLDAQLEATGGRGRVQFIKRPEITSGQDFAFFVAHTQETSPQIFQFQLEAYEELLDLDVAALLADGSAYDHFRYRDPLYLVCTNGLRDRCCALYGLTLYRALFPLAKPAVWQTTHVGGHRFAANLVAFPDGTYYGRLQPDEVEDFLAAHRRGDLFLNRLRGRVCYDEVVQAADYFLRRESGQLALDAFHHTSTHSTDDKVYSVQFAERGDDAALHAVQLRREPSELPLLVSCGKQQTKPVWQYELTGYNVTSKTQERASWEVPR